MSVPDPHLGFERGELDGPDGRLSYLRGGSGAPLVLLHSLALGAPIWTSTLAELGRGHDVIALDVRGHGASGWSGRDFSVQDLATDALATMDHLGLDRAAVLGLSMGGSVALTLAGSQPGRVASLVLCDTTAWYGPDAVSAWGQRAEQAAGRPRSAQIGFQMERWFTSTFCAQHPDVVATVTGLFLSCAPAVHAAACRALGALDSRPLLGAITAPTLVITGRDDLATPPPMGEAIAAAVPGATMVTPEGKHFAILESPRLRELAAAHLAGIALPTLGEGPEPCCAGAPRGEAA